MVEEPPSPFQLRVKAGTIVLTAAVTAALLLYDWDKSSSSTGANIFSQIRPSLKGFFNYLYGVDTSKKNSPPSAESDDK